MPTTDENPVYVELPPEDPDFGTGLCGKLNVHMYGTRRAADGWHCEYSDALQSLGFEPGQASACVFVHKVKHLVMSVHGDDFTTAGPKTSIDWFVSKLRERYELKESARIGGHAKDSKEARVLNRIVRWTDSGLEYEADPRQAEKLVQELGLENCKSVSTPAVKATAEQHHTDREVEAHKTTHFRALAARANYLSADRPDCQFGAKEVCRFMATPTQLSVEALKRLGRYLVGHPRLIYKYPFQDQVEACDVYADTDYAGCLRTRKSTSGGCIVMGGHLIKSWASTQPIITLSSGEAELHGVVKAAANGLGYLSLLADFGIRVPLRIWTDSTASKGICSRQGLGKVRHLEVQALWVQQRVRNGDLSLYKVAGEDNPADLFTKAGLTQQRIQSLLTALGCEFRDGRAKSAPALRQEGGTKLFHIGGVSLRQNPRRVRAKGGMIKWADMDDDADRLYTTEEVKEIVKNWMPFNDSVLHNESSLSDKLPHQRAMPEPLMVPAAHSELVEPADALTELGTKIGSAEHGRGALPLRLQQDGHAGSEGGRGNLRHHSATACAEVWSPDPNSFQTLCCI